MVLLVLVWAVLIVVGGYLYCMNRALPGLKAKVVPAVFVGIIGGLLTVYYSLKSETVERDFTSTVHFHKSDLLCWMNMKVAIISTAAINSTRAYETTSPIVLETTTSLPGKTSRAEERLRKNCIPI